MSAELAELVIRIDEFTGGAPSDANIIINDERLRRASKLKPGDQIIDCAFKVVTVKEVTCEIATFANFTSEEADALDWMCTLPEAELRAKFQELFNAKPLTYELIDVGILDSNGGQHSFFYCCHFLDEHENCYPKIGLVHPTP